VSGRSHFAAPMLLAIMVALILYVSLYPFRFAADGPSIATALQQLTWARASRGDMFNNVLLYLPLGFCIALAIEPRFGRLAGIVAGLAGGALLSLAMEVTQASIAPRVPSLTDLSLNAAGALAGAIGGSAWHVLGARMTPHANPQGRSAAIALAILVLWLLARLWPIVPDLSLGQFKRAVRPLFSPELAWPELAAYFVGWLVVAQAVFHLARRQRSVDAFLVVIAVVLVGRALTAGNELEVAELAALALLLPVLVRSAASRIGVARRCSRRCWARGSSRLRCCRHSGARRPRNSRSRVRPSSSATRRRRHPTSPARGSATSPSRGCLRVRGCSPTSRPASRYCSCCCCACSSSASTAPCTRGSTS